MRSGAVFVLSLSLVGCAAVFRDSHDKVHIESTPVGAEARRGDAKLGTTPGDFDVDRSKSTQITLVKTGYEDAPIPVKKNINPGWLVLDIATCVFPIALCIPLLVDAVSGAWNDVDHNYNATMKPGSSAATSVAAAAASAAASGSASPPPAGGVTSPPPDMSESERKATARAAYQEGVLLQEKGNCPQALSRLESAQKFYSAPTHLLHIAQCQAATGKLVESAETYETLVRTTLPKDAPEPFRQAQEAGKKEITAIRPRIPTLRIQLTPAPNTLSSLVVKLNGGAVPSEVLGLARPVNPGTYKIAIWAAGYREANAEVEVGEATARVAEIKLQK